MVAVPTSVAPAKKSTLVTVAVPTALALATSAVAVPSVTDVPATGLVSVTVGAVTLTLTTDDVTWVLLESVTRAVSAVMPDAAGVQVIE